MSKTKLVRTIGGVVKAFANGEKPPEGELFHTRCGRLRYDGKLMTAYPSGGIGHADYLRVVGVRRKHNKPLIFCSRYFDWYTRIHSELRASGKEIISVNFSWNPTTTNMADINHVLYCIYESMERAARLKAGLKREDVVADWTILCHELGFGNRMPSPPCDIDDEAPL